jgi:signal transduction histidine kinase
MALHETQQTRAETELERLIQANERLEREVAERMQAEETLRHYAERLQVLLEIDQGILAAQLPDAIAQATVAHIRQLFPCPRVDIFMYDLKADEAVLLASDLDTETKLVVGTRTPLGPWQDAIEVARRGQVVVVTDLLSRGWAAEMVYAEGIHTFYAMPLIFRGELIGSINLTLDDSEMFTPELEDTLRQVADQLAIAIQQASLNEQVQRHAEELERRVADRTRELLAMYEVMAIASQPVDLETTLARSLERVLSAVQGTEGVIYLLDEAQGMLHLAVQQGFGGGFPPDMVSLPAEDLGEWVIENGKAVFLPNRAADPWIGTHSRPPRKYTGIPMRAGGRVLGVLGVIREIAQPSFTDQEIALLTTLADRVGAVVESARLRQRAEQAAVLEERQRLARELHDSVTQSLYSLTLLAAGWRNMVENGQVVRLQEPLAEMGDVAQQALKEMRLLIHELRPPVLEEEGLLGALHQRLGAVEQRAGVEARLVAEDVIELPGVVKEGLYRIALEALNNALKHAAASSVTVHIGLAGERVELKVTDDGCGFDPDGLGENLGVGLITMRERAEQLRGTLVVYSVPGQGTTVQVSVPAAERVET